MLLLFYPFNLLSTSALHAMTILVAAASESVGDQQIEKRKKKKKK